MHLFHKWFSLTPDEAQVKLHGGGVGTDPPMHNHWSSGITVPGGDWCPYPWRHYVCDVCGLIKAPCKVGGAYWFVDEKAMLDSDVVFTALVGCKTLDEAERKAIDLEQ